MLCNIYMISAIQKSSKKKVIDLRKPYIDNEINQYIKSKRRLQRLYIKYFVTYKKQYKDCRNLVTRLVREARNRLFPVSQQRC